MSEDSPIQPTEQPLVEHLIELRRRLVWIIAILIICFLALMPWSQYLYTFIATPLLAKLPAGSTMIATDVIAPLFVPIKVTLMAALLISLPNTLYQIWAFIAPGLYQHEKRFIAPLVISSTVLFFIGMIFAYFLILPIVFKFLVNVTPDGVNMATDIDKYLSFLLGMFIAFGTAFETPIVVILLTRSGVIRIEQLKKSRPYVVVIAFTIAAFITPPDVISQILLAIPLLILYELGILFSQYLSPTTHQHSNSHEKDCSS